MGKLQKLINEENWLLDLADSAKDFKDIQSAFDKVYNDASRNKIFEFKRKIKEEIDVILSKQGPLLPEEELALIMFKYTKFNGEWVLISDLKDAEKQLKLKLKEEGYIYSEHFQLSSIKSENLYFSKSFYILKYFFNEFGIEVIRVNQELVDKLNCDFNAEIKNLRSFLSNLERYDFIRKIDTGVFVKRKTNEAEIADKMVDILSNIDFNFLTKDKIQILVDSVIRDEELLLDEFYYILKNNSSGKFYFSTGNSMYIAKNKKMADESASQRILDITVKYPVILTLEEMSFKLGFGRTAPVNFENTYIIGDNFLFFNKRNEKNIKYMKKIFGNFFKDRSGTLFYTAEIRDYLENYGTEFTERFSNAYSFSNLLPYIYDDVKYDAKTKAYTYKVDSHQIIDLDDWGDF